MILHKQQHHAVHRNCMMLFCFLLPLSPRLAVWAIVLAALNWLAEGEFLKKIAALLQPLPLLFFLFYAWHWVGMIYTEHTDLGLRILETKLSLFAFPLLLLGKPQNPTLRKNSLLAFVGGCLIASLYCLARAGLTWIRTGENHFFYQDLSDYLQFHPTYFALYLGFCVFLLIRHLLLYPTNYRIPVLSTVLFLLLFIFLLAARMQLLILVSLLSATWIYWMYHRGQLLRGLAFALLGFVLIAALSWTLPVTKKRIQQAMAGINDPDAGNVRWDLWEAAVFEIKKNPLLGVGTGDVQNRLDAAFLELGFETPYQEHLNAHNGYLQVALALGFLGLLIWLAHLLYPLWLAWFNHRAFTYVWFLLLFILSNLTESMLETQRGVMFFAFFNALLVGPLVEKTRNKQINR